MWIDTWIDIRDRIVNKWIKFLLRHCGLDYGTMRAFIRKMELCDLEALTYEKRHNRERARR